VAGPVLRSTGDSLPGTVVSGGQTGVDRAALEVAIELGIPYGGWCPAGGWAEDRDRPPGLLEHFPKLRETPSSDPTQRTEWNVRDSDATLVLKPRGVESPGTLLSEEFARGLHRPLLRLDPGDRGAAEAAARFIAENCPGGRLNVAGPRESGAPGVYGAARLLLEALLGSEAPS